MDKINKNCCQNSQVVEQDIGVIFKNCYNNGSVKQMLVSRQEIKHILLEI